MTYGWDAGNLIDNECRADNFHTFVTNVLEKLPGIYSRSLHEFVGPPDQPIEFIGKYENLVEDLVTALQLAGEQFDPAAIRNLPPYNVSDKKSFPAAFTPALEAHVLAAEAEAVSRFRY